MPDETPRKYEWLARPPPALFSVGTHPGLAPYAWNMDSRHDSQDLESLATKLLRQPLL